MSTEDKLAKLQESMELLLQQNTALTTKIEALEQESMKIASKVDEKATRVAENVETLESANQAAQAAINGMVATRKALVVDGWSDEGHIPWFFNSDSFKALMSEVTGGQGTLTEVAVESTEEGSEPSLPFDNKGREEKLDVVFGLDGDMSAKSLRRFVEKFRVVKKLNMAAMLTGWDDKEYRANKLKLALQGEAFDFVSFEGSMGRAWTMDGEEIIEKLKDRYLNIQAVEMNILRFEQSCQERQELLNEYLARLQQLVKDAYEGDEQNELDRKVAWKFVSGVLDDKIQTKLMQEGWMKTRREAKPLEELLKLAEVTKQTEEAVKAMNAGSASGSISALHSAHYDDQVNVVRAKQHSSDSNRSRGSESVTSSGSSGMALEVLNCWYCNKQHRGGWFYCYKRKKENPNWRPEARRNTKKDKQQQLEDRSRKDF